MKIPSRTRLLIKCGEGKDSQLFFQIPVYTKLHYGFQNADLFSSR